MSRNYITRDHCIRRGDAWVGEIYRIKSDVGSEFWDNWVAASQLRTASDGTLAHTFALDGSVTEEDGVGILTLNLKIDAVDTATLSAQRYVGDIEVESDFLPKSTLVTFRVTILPDVTRT